MTAAEAFVLHLAKRGMESDSFANRLATDMIEVAQEQRGCRESEPTMRVTFVEVSPGSVTTALEPLGLAKRIDPYRRTVKIKLEPWIVEAALARLDDKRLSPTEQRIILAATRMPHEVRWPDWWTERV